MPQDVTILRKQQAIDKPSSPVIDFVASEPHFVDHVLPVYDALPQEMRGAIFSQTDRKVARKRSNFASYGDMILVASYGDLRRVRSSRKPVIFMEHGVGHTPSGSEYLKSYAGSFDRPGVALFLNVNQIVQAANKRSFPYASHHIIGSPKMDKWHSMPLKPRGKKPTIGIAFHWDCLVANRTRSALDHYEAELKNLASYAKASGWSLLGHGHPRIYQRLKVIYKELNIPHTESYEVVFKKADMLIADATSLAYEFASLDRPVVNLNAPWYYEESDTSSLRFWKFIPGAQVDEPQDLIPTVELALTDPPKWAALRNEAINAVYPNRGLAAQAASSAIEKFITSCM